MSENKLTWEEELAVLLVAHRYSENVQAALKFANEECWQVYKESDYSPLGAIIEDLSYAQ